MRTPDHLGRSSEAKNPKKTKKIKCDGWTNGPTDGPTKRGVELRSTRLKIASCEEKKGETKRKTTEKIGHATKGNQR